MITLTGQREIAGCNVYRDDVDPLAYYIMPQSPRIALDDAGKPIFSLVWFRRDVSKMSEEERKTRLGGGILTLSVELATTDKQMEEIRTTLAGDPALQTRLASDPHDPTRPPTAATGPDYRSWWANEIHRDAVKLAAALKVSTVPVSDGTVAVQILAESPTGQPGDFVSTLVGGGGVSMTGRERASFMAKLTQDGVVLLWQMVERNLPAIRIAYDLKFNHRLDAVRMVVWCDAKKAFDAVQEQWQHITDDASWSVTSTDDSTWYTFGRDQVHDARDRIGKVAHDSEASRVEIIPEAGADVVKPEQMTQLTQLGNDMIKDFLAATFLEFKTGQDVQTDQDPHLDTALPEQDGKKYGHQGIDFYNLKTWHEEMEATLDYQFRSQAVLEGHLRPNDNIANVLGGHDVKSLRTQIEIDADWLKYLDVTVISTADFDDDPVDLVKAHLAYKQKGAQGDIDSVQDLVFTKGTPPQHFTTFLASPDQLQYDFQYDIFYKGSSQTMSVAGKSEDTVLVLDTDRLGILRVDLQIGLVNWDRIRSVFVKMWYGDGSARKETELTLDAQRQTGRWTEVIAKPVTDAYNFQLTFVDKQDQRIEVAPDSSRSKTLIINQPLQEALEVAVVPAGSYGTGGLLSQVVVALRYADAANNYDVQDVFTMVKEGDSKVWTVPLIDKTLRQYQYRVTVFYSDGVTREDDWQTTDKTVLPVGDPFGSRVQILPYLLRNPPGLYQFGTIHLAFDDAQAGIHAEKDFEINDFTKPLVWRFRLGAPDRHTYQYQLSLFKADGQEVRVQGSESKEVLVLVPPPPAPPAPAPSG